MTQPRPTAPELLEAVRGFLDDELLPELEGRRRFHARVASNVLEMVERELRHGPEAVEAEHARLVELLDRPGPDGRSTDALTRELAGAIRAGTIDIADPRLIDHLARTAAADVAIANPRWVTPSADSARPAES